MVWRLSLLLVLLSASPASAQLWSNILAPARAVRWQDNAGVLPEGAIPSDTGWTQCGATITVNGALALQTINNAIAACGANTYVLLSAGTQTFSSGNINLKTGVELRGSGPVSTILKFGGGGGGFISSYIVASSADTNCDGEPGAGCHPSHSTTWTGTNGVAGTYTQGATSIRLGSTANLSVGQVLILDQDDDANDTGDWWQCGAKTTTPGCVFTGNSIAGARNCNGTTTGVTGLDVSGCTGQNINRTALQHVLVTAISGNDVTIFPGIYQPTWRTSQNPGVWWATTPAKNTGVRNLTVDAFSTGGSANLILLFNCYGCWVKNVRGLGATNTRATVQCYLCARSTVRDSYFWSSFNCSGSCAEHYGVETFEGGDLLVENNIMHHIVGGVLFGVGHGNVAAYNYRIEEGNTGNFQYGAIINHDSAAYLMAEGNDLPNIVDDDNHGTHNMNTHFRNRLSGVNAPRFTVQTVPFLTQATNRYFNLVGNVLGQGGYHTSYQSIVGSINNCEHSIYNFGFGNTSCAADTTVVNDPLVASTVMRWGNYDVANNGVRFVAGENGSGANVFPALTNPSQTFPPSFYHTTKPTSWWGPVLGQPEPPWPAIGPDVLNGNVVSGSGASSTLGGHAFKIPSRLCFENTAVDPLYGSSSPRILNFDGAACYIGSSGGPVPQPVTNFHFN